MTPDELLTALRRETTTEERISYAASLASYKAFLAGVKRGAERGMGSWDEDSEAWADWFEGER